MTTPLTAKRKREAIQRARDRVKACELAFIAAMDAVEGQDGREFYRAMGRADAARCDLEAAREKLARIIKEYGE